MWFSIIKNKLLTKPKIQLRVQNNKAVEDEEPCKKRLKRYIDFFEKQDKNYKVMEDPKIKNIIEEYKLKPFKKEGNFTDLYYTEDMGYPTRNALENNDFFVSLLMVYYYVNYDRDLWKDLPERVACEVLDMIDSKTEAVVKQWVGSYHIGVEYNNNPQSLYGLDSGAQWVIDISMDREDNHILFMELYNTVTITPFKDIYKDKRNENLEASRPFVNKIKDIFDKIADPKNWK